jgi:hypothetical protein
MKTKYIRYSRILKHSLQYLITDNIIYWWEVQHYYYMKSFKQINKP